MFTASSKLMPRVLQDRKSTRLNSSHLVISYAVFCLKKNIVLLLLSVPIDADRFMVQESFREDGYDTRFSVRVLARPIDIAVAQRCICQAVCLFPVAQVVFRDHLGDTVW